MDDRRKQSAFSVLTPDGLWFAAVHIGYEAVGRAQVNANDQLAFLDDITRFEVYSKLAHADILKKSATYGKETEEPGTLFARRTGSGFAVLNIEIH